MCCVTPVLLSCSVSMELYFPFPLLSHYTAALDSSSTLGVALTHLVMVLTKLVVVLSCGFHIHVVVILTLLLMIFTHLVVMATHLVVLLGSHTWLWLWFYYDGHIFVVL